MTRLTCKCTDCPTPPKAGAGAFCSWCAARLFAQKISCHGSSVCFLPPCSGRVLVPNEHRATHYIEGEHSNPDEDDERFLRKLGLRRHPDRVSPLDTMDAG